MAAEKSTPSTVAPRLAAAAATIAWPTGDIEKAHIFLQTHRLEQRRNGLPGQATESFVVTRGYFLPAGVFEITKFFRLQGSLGVAPVD